MSHGDTHLRAVDRDEVVDCDLRRRGGRELRGGAGRGEVKRGEARRGGVGCGVRWALTCTCIDSDTAPLLVSMFMTAQRPVAPSAW